MAGSTKLLTSSGGGVILTPASNIAADVTVSIPSVTGTAGIIQNNIITSATAVASTSGTSIDFTGIPAGVKRVTVMFNGVSTNGTSVVQVQVGAGSVTTSGYVSNAIYTQNSLTPAGAQYTSGFGTISNLAANIRTGILTLVNITSNSWVGNGTIVLDDSAIGGMTIFGGKIALSGTLDRVRITTVNGTDTFDAGSINILYE